MIVYHLADLSFYKGKNLLRAMTFDSHNYRWVVFFYFMHLLWIYNNCHNRVILTVIWIPEHAATDASKMVFLYKVKMQTWFIVKLMRLSIVWHILVDILNKWHAFPKVNLPVVVHYWTIVKVYTCYIDLMNLWNMINKCF